MSSYIPCVINGIDLRKTFNLIKNWEITTASTESLFNGVEFENIKDIEIKENNKEAIIRLNNGNFLVLEGG